MYPPEVPGELPRVILEGNLPELLKLARVGMTRKGDTASTTLLDRAIECSVKRDPGAKPLAFPSPGTTP